ncbi:MAG: hypothetical protein ACTHOO_01495 [Alcanivorax sp.]
MIGVNQYKIFFVFFATLFAITACNAQYDYEKNLNKLKYVCLEKTKTDTEGRVYKPIIGRYFGKKSVIYDVSQGIYRTESGGYASTSRPDDVGFQLHLINETKEEKVHASFSSEQQEYLFQKLFSIIGEKTFKQKLETKEEYGICAYKNDHDIDIGDIETFMKLGMK